jgi:hypothetical protein
MYRRDFIKTTTLASVTGSSIINGLYMNRLFEGSTGIPVNIDVPSPYLNRLVVKPILTSMYHTDIWEGPCRFDVASSENEKKAALKSFDGFIRTLNNKPFNKSNVDLLEPGQVMFVEDFKISEDDFKKLGEDADKADVLYINPQGSSIAAYDIARRFNKPVILSGNLSCRTVDISAFCRSNGLECYVPNSFEETDDMMTLLKARKNFSQTRILYPTEWGWPAVASVAGINEPEKLKEQFGIEVIRISYDELSKEMERTKNDKGLIRDAGEMADTMYKNADHSFIEKKYVAKSFVFYQSVVNLMKRHNCNAFTIECFEFCTSRLPEKWNITPCLIHTMLKDLGIPSACEGDLGGLLAMHMLMLLSNKSPILEICFIRLTAKSNDN